MGKYMMVKQRMGDCNNLHMGNNTLEQVQEFKYFSTTLNIQDNINGEINIRLSAFMHRKPS